MAFWSLSITDHFVATMWLCLAPLPLHIVVLRVMSFFCFWFCGGAKAFVERVFCLSDSWPSLSPALSVSPRLGSECSLDVQSSLSLGPFCLLCLFHLVSTVFEHLSSWFEGHSWCLFHDVTIQTPLGSCSLLSGDACRWTILKHGASTSDPLISFYWCIL